MVNLIPSYIIEIIKLINSHGYEAYLVGGAVRDILIGKEPKDWDIATNAEPKEIKNIFKDTIDSGIKYGTVIVIFNGKSIEITTYRKEHGYSDNRRPDSVEFITDLKEDLGRRDFTVNAIAYNPDIGFKDFNNGIQDIENKIIRCVGNPDDRFKEDALRIIRAARFAAELNFEIEMLTFEAGKRNSNLISNIAVERIRTEIDKILVSNNVRKGIDILSHTGLLKLIIPELDDCKGFKQDNPHHEYDVYEHILNSTVNIKPQLYLRLTMLFHDLGKLHTKTIDKKGVGHFYKHEVISAKLAGKILERLKYDNKTKEKVINLIKFHDYRINADEISVRRALNKIGREFFEDYLTIREADIKAQSRIYMQEKLTNLKSAKEIYKKIIKNNQPIDIKDLQINGFDLINMGIQDGKQIRLTLDYLMKRVLENPELNQRDALTDLADDFN